MDRAAMMERIRTGSGIIAPLDQSGGSTPKTLLGYGLPPDAWSNEAEMFELVHRMRSRILTSPAFTANRILGTILFVGTMDGKVEGRPVPRWLHEKGIVPFVKVDQGLQTERDGVQLMKPLTQLGAVLDLARQHRIFGTKTRSVIRSAHAAGIAAVVKQQFEVGLRIAQAGLVPILEPEYDIYAADRAEGEPILLGALLDELERRSAEQPVVLKLSIPVKPDTYRRLVGHPKVLRVVALSGGYGRHEACEKLALNHGMIASFSRALMSDLRVTMTGEEFDAALAAAIEQIYCASVSPSR